MTLRQEFMKHAAQFKAIAASLVLLTAPACASSSIPAQSPINVQSDLSRDIVHQIEFTEHKSSDLAEKYSFIREAMQPRKAPDGSDETVPAFPEYIKVAEINISDKNLNLVAFMIEGVGYCTNNGLCSLSFYTPRSDGAYEQVSAMWNSAISSYYITNEDSFSVVYCENSNFQRWQLKDGTLEKPLPMNQTGYFTYEGVYKNPAMTNGCPPDPAR